MFTLRRIALVPRVCGATVTVPQTAVSKPIMNCIQQQCLRRYSSSSSKPSNPSDGARSPSSSSSSDSSTTTMAQAQTMKRNGKAGLKVIKTPSGAMKEGTKIPVVPSTDHLHPVDVALSTFFAQHRPVSISHAVPLIHSAPSFDAIFARRKFSPIDDRPRGSTPITSSDFQSLDPADSEPTIRSSSEQTAIQIPAHLVQLVEKYMPFNPPPTPTPQTAFVRPMPLTRRKKMAAEEGMEVPFSDKVRQPQVEPVVGVGEMAEPGEETGVMQTLSVKRRRGLKMKKHKLKKLRKRTRNLRRRIESHSR